MPEVRARLAVVLAFLLIPLGAPTGVALEPGEALKDPALEARARAISQKLRCVVCQNQSIDDSFAPLARDLRRLVRERLLKGDTDDQVIAWVRERYGDFVLLSPPVRPATYLLWFGPAIVLLVAAGLLLWRRRRAHSRAPAAEAPLTAAEEARLVSLLEDRPTPAAGRERDV